MATELQVITGTFEAGDLLPSRATAQRQLQSVREFQATVRELFIQGHDFGVIPGTGTKATLLKPGAEKLAKLLGLSDNYEIAERTEDWDRPLFRYLVRCSLVHIGSGATISQGLGECNSMESKYRWRWIWPNDLSKEEKARYEAAGHFRTTRNGGKQYRTENDDIYSQINTILKMAKKRALVDAALSAGRLSDVFTQDIEDFVDADSTPATPAPVQSVPPADEPDASGVDELAIAWDKWNELAVIAVRVGVSFSNPPQNASVKTIRQYIGRLAVLVEEAQRAL